MAFYDVITPSATLSCFMCGSWLRPDPCSTNNDSAVDCSSKVVPSYLGLLKHPLCCRIVG
jgi:hypothetical protein